LTGASTAIRRLFSCAARLACVYEDADRPL
jgi:hypothetical protein